MQTRGWSKRAIAQFPLCLAPSTLASYNGVLRKLCDFCQTIGVAYPPLDTPTIADFLCHVADSSASPRSQLKITMAALNHLYANDSLQHVLDRRYLAMLETALIKSATSKPMTRSSVMPIQPFHDLFTDWDSNEILSVAHLRLKCITLMALALMLRPSDIAPKTVQFDPESMDTHKYVFTSDNVSFLASGAAQITFHGVKNDTCRSGFRVTMQPYAGPSDPVDALKVYLARTSAMRPPGNPVFLTLTKPYRPISASTVAAILNEAISLAGLSDLGFSAKSFRPTGATAAMAANCDPETAMQLGRWKTRSVFFDHYVHCTPPETLTKDILCS